MDKIDYLRQLVMRRLDEGKHPNAVIFEIGKLITQHSLDIRAIDLVSRIQYERSFPPQQPAPVINDTAEENDTPADRADMAEDYLDDHPKKHFRREDIQEYFGWSRDQTQRTLKKLREEGRIGYEEVNHREPNPNDPKKYLFRKDAVYFSIKDRPPQPTLPVTLKTMDEVFAFINKWKFLCDAGE